MRVDPRNVHAYVMGEHGDSEFVPWSQAFLATKPILELGNNGENELRSCLDHIEEEVRTAAYRIIEAKQATYYGIGMALTRITKAINDGDFFNVPEFLTAVENCKKINSALHLLGLVSTGGVHSHLNHIYGL